MTSNAEILLKFIQGDAGKAWANLHVGWKVGSKENVCDWDYVDCDSTGTRIISIEATAAGLKATIPSELGLLPYLERVVLDNQNGVDTSFSGLTGSIPPELASLSNLIEVNLAFNALTGSIPTFASAKLQTLNLSSNQLSGPLSTESFYGSKGHGSLLKLDLATNQLTGSIPTSVGQLGRLNTLSLSDNKFSGTLPSDIGALKDLRWVYINSNRFQGTLPTGFVNPDAELKEVWLHENLLSGTVPIAFGQMTKLNNLYVDGNKFTGSVPKALCTDTLNTDFVTEPLYDNATGVTADTCVRLACPMNQYSAEGLWPCTDCPQGYSTPYLGTEVECFPSDQGEVLKKMYESTGGTKWTITNNNWQNGTDECQFTGIECNNNGHITKISLPNSGLQGPFPNIIGFLEHLDYVDLSDNALTGYLSADLQWPPIDHFDISGNKIRGVIPPWLCLSGGMNENGDGGHFHCNLVACPAGTHSPIGRESMADNIKCQPCKQQDAIYIGMKNCNGAAVSQKKPFWGTLIKAPKPTVSISSTTTSSTASSSGPSASKIAGIVILVLASVGIVVFAAVRVAKRMKAKKEEEHEALNTNITSMRSGSSWNLSNREVL